MYFFIKCIYISVLGNNTQFQSKSRTVGSRAPIKTRQRGEFEATLLGSHSCTLPHNFFFFFCRQRDRNLPYMSCYGLALQSPPFMRSTDHPAVPWERWHSMFETHLHSYGASDFSSERCRAILMNCLQDGLRPLSEAELKAFLLFLNHRKEAAKKPVEGT